MAAVYHGTALAALDRIEAEVERRKRLHEQDDALIVSLRAEVERLRAAFSRYGDHDRACDARENALYACTCGFVAKVEELFPSRAALAKEKV